MSNVSQFQTLPAAESPERPSSTPPAPAGRQRLRAVGPDDVPPAPDFLPPGATWMPAPGHVIPAVAGGAPMVGYLVLGPAERTPPARRLAGAAPLPVPPVRIDRERRTAAVDGRPLD